MANRYPRLRFARPPAAVLRSEPSTCHHSVQRARGVIGSLQLRGRTFLLTDPGSREVRKPCPTPNRRK